jgi:uncharacterized membrane protein YhaH (DUF805 family)
MAEGDPGKSRTRTGFWKRLFSQEGRAGRVEFWWIFAIASAAIVSTIVGYPYFHGFANRGLGALCWFACLAPSFWLALCVITRRLHDAGLSDGWFAVPVVGWRLAALLVHGVGGSEEQVQMTVAAVVGVFFLVIGSLKGTAGDNAYGPDPRSSV